jgi:hypothetical protein
MISVDITKTLDTASPAIQTLLARMTPRKIAEKLDGPMVHLVKANFESLPENIHGFPASGFWKDCSRATAGRIDDDGLVVYCNKIGARLRYFGGAIKAGAGTSSFTGQPTKYLVIPANGEAYAHTPAMFNRLRLVQFGRGQDAPRALVQVPRQGPQRPKRKSDQGPAPQPLGEVVMFWLKKQVTQQPNPAVLPSDDQIMETAEKALGI